MKKIAFLVSIILLFAFQTINAQNDILPEKQQAIKDLLLLINKDNNSEDMTKAMMAQMDLMHEEIVKAILDERTDLTASERKNVEKALIGEYQKQSKIFQDKLIQKLDLNKTMGEIMTALYDKYYTLEEINDLTAFYKTPTGQKTLKTMQPLVLDTLKMTQEKLVPKMISIMQEIREEQRREIAKKAEEIMPRKRKQNK